MSDETRLADRVDAWLQVCGACDAGMYECTHPHEDPRTIISDLWDEVTRLRDQLARVRTDTITEAEKAIRGVYGVAQDPDHALDLALAAVRGVSHEH